MKKTRETPPGADDGRPKGVNEMTREEKIEIIADILEVEPDEVQEDMVLEDFETWDSVAVLSVIAMMDEHFGKYL